MAIIRTRRRLPLAFDALTVEGALISPTMLAQIAMHQADGQAEADYDVPRGLTLRDEIARYFRIGQALFASFTASESPSAAATVGFVERLLRDVLGFAELSRVGTRTLGDRQFAVTMEGVGGRVPVVVVPPSDELDRPSGHLPTDGRRRSAALAIQEWLNANEAAAWGLASNGLRLRLVRDNSSLSRPAYIEANLSSMFEEENFADFAALWLLVHASRFGQPGAPASDCALERWRDAGQKEGIAARERLREGVEAALLSLGNGFLTHPNNGALRDGLQNGSIPLPRFFGQLLSLVYRLIFLFVAEDRDLLHPPATGSAVSKLYGQGYSVRSLRDHALRRSAWDRHHDRWEGLLITFAALATGERRLGLPALDGLFAPNTLADLDNAKLANRPLMEAIHRLAWLKDNSGLVPVNWRDMETEELGSVYESLLELTPQVNGDGRGFAFAEGGEAKGHIRRTTGSYYTPDSLVQTLLDSALDPVLDRIEAEAADPAAALLSLRVLDPACGSGHFLLAAARRIATRLERARTGGVASPTDFRSALREVVRLCIYGVDRNPMAVELTKVALWIETVEPGKPLGFLDANIRCGDSLLGVFDLEGLTAGIPDDAYKPLTGDDKEAAKIAGRINREQRESVAQQALALVQSTEHLARAASAVTVMPEDDLAGVRARARAHEAVHADRGWWATKTACDLYVTAFLAPKRFRAGALARAQAPDRVPTTLDVRTALADRQVDAQLLARAVELAGAARAFHWPLEFPAVIASGGFDAVLGNPPWERIKLQEQEFFAAREPEIAMAPNAAARRRLVAKLKDAAPGTRDRALYEEFEAAKRTAEASSMFARVPGDEGGRFALTGQGDVNTYALFAELFACLSSPGGRAGVIVPTGIATDATTAPFFAALVAEGRLVQLIDFENRDAIFPAVHRSYKFSLMTIGRGCAEADFGFFLTNARQLGEPERRFTLSAKEIARINPNTRTAPVFRSRLDAELTAKIYARVPVLIDKAKGASGNPWNVSFMRMFDMSNDSSLFRTAAQLSEAGFVRDGSHWVTPMNVSPDYRQDRYLPLYEAKMIHQFDHRWATYSGTETRDVASEEKADFGFEPTPRYWVPECEVGDRLDARGWRRGWLMGWRQNARSTDDRTMTVDAIPRCGAGNSIILLDTGFPGGPSATLLGCLNSLPHDFVVRQKVGGVNMSFYFVEQFPVLPPSSYGPADLAFLVPRIVELTYTSHSMTPFARDLGYDGPPFAWDEDRRAHLRAELDAWYARAYGLGRDELRYILDPADVKGADYPSETFRVLKTNEIRRFGEYRTARLVLAAYDRLAANPIAAVPGCGGAADLP